MTPQETINELTKPFWVEGQKEVDIDCVIRYINDRLGRHINYSIHYGINICFGYWEIDNQWEIQETQYIIPNKPLQFYTPEELQNLALILEKIGQNEVRK